MKQESQEEVVVVVLHKSVVSLIRCVDSDARCRLFVPLSARAPATFHVRVSVVRS